MDALGRVLDSQQFILGEHVEAFERAAAERLGVKHALGCSSGTDSFWLALAGGWNSTPASVDLSLWGPRSGAGVVTTPFSFFASVSAILRAGARPVLADTVGDVQFVAGCSGIGFGWRARSGREGDSAGASSREML